MNQNKADALQEIRNRMLATSGASHSTPHVGRFATGLKALTGWALAGALILAPWLYGGTRPWTVGLLNMILLGIVVPWLSIAVISKTFFKLPRVLLAAAFLLLLQGWWMTLNAHFVHDSEYSTFAPAATWSENAPGSVDKISSLDMMLRISALVGVVLMGCDLSRSRRWRMRLWWASCIAGISVILLGLIQKLAEAPMIFWQGGRTGHHFFATYLYHGNAGAFINLVLPLVAGLNFMVFQKGRTTAMTFMASGLLICVAGAFSHASKAGAAVSVFLMLVLMVWQARLFLGYGNLHQQRASNLLSFGIGIAAVIAVVLAVGWQFAAQRWHLFDVSRDARMFTYNMCHSMLPDAGAFGFGPGTFSIMFDRYALAANPAMQVFYRYAHQDYMQALIEWGWVGASLMGTIFFGGLLGSFWRYFANSQDWRSYERVLVFSIGLALLGVAMHAAVDFPLQIYSLQLFAAVYLGLAWGSGSWTRPPGNRNEGRRRAAKERIKRRSHPESDHKTPTNKPITENSATGEQSAKKSATEKRSANKSPTEKRNSKAKRGR
ncbi:hypothetical protein FEM03_22810 [Phragmitibacter flavus]|uniref:O-antigen ligase family protein n=1 Tax=Phragmitibacter flavus TaxID=2576071 RepID=A0A5R8K7X2_9BACT|nr:hypothetical protein [Phragmitibacter flavus]TLD68438.1 hypothetical protein FEM03_22810 [Phragmitibacter flavus]